MSLGNIPSEICNRPSSQAWILIGLLPVGPKRNPKVKGFSTQEQEYDALKVQHRVLGHILWPLIDLYKVRTKSHAGSLGSELTYVM